MATLVQLGCISHLPIVVDGVVLDSSRPAQSLEIIEWLHSHCVSVTMGSLSVVIFFLIQCYPIHPFHSVSRSGTDRGGGCYFPTHGRLGCLFVLFIFFCSFYFFLFFASISFLFVSSNAKHRKQSPLMRNWLHLKIGGGERRCDCLFLGFFLFFRVSYFCFGRGR